MRITSLLVILLSLTPGLGPKLGLASDYHSPRTAAIGGAGHAGPLLNDAIYLNPSFGSFMPAYSLSANYLFFKSPRPSGQDFDAHHGHTANVSVQDGRSELFQAGVGFTQTDASRIVNIGASKAFLQRYGVGIGAKLLLPFQENRTMIQDGLASVSLIASDWCQVVGVVDNVLETSDGKARGLYREYIAGTKLNIQSMILLYFDPHLAPSVSQLGQPSFGFESGIEFTAMSDLLLRGGIFRDAHVPFVNTRGSGYGLGFGWLAPRVSFDFAMSRISVPFIATAYTAGMTVYF
ncbi:hypothetical protein WDW86_20475 [Bdellovibrionota bacterium FG-2]